MTAVVEPVQPWRPFTLTAFRFSFVYFGLYILTTQMFSGMFLFIPIPELQGLPPLSNIIIWVGAHLLPIDKPIAVTTTGSGDKMFDWVHSFTLLLIAAISVVVWALLAKGRTSHPRANKWFRVFVRWGLATTMFSYGFAKVVPLQMPYPSLSRLLQPYGTFSPMGILWSSVGAAPGYEVFIGCAEVFGGILLFWPRTTLFGAMVCLMDGIGILALNLTYDVPVKLFAFHIVLLSLFLLAPNLRVLYGLLFLEQTVTPVREPRLGATPVSQRRWTIGQVAFGMAALAFGTYSDIGAWKSFGGGAPKSPLYGIWKVEEMVVDSVSAPLLVTDSTRWRHVIFQSPTAATFQRMNDHTQRFSVVIDTTKHTIALSEPAIPGAAVKTDTTKPKPTLSYQRTAPNRLLLYGDMDGHNVRLQLALRSMDEFELKTRGFNWVQERPYNK